MAKKSAAPRQRELFSGALRTSITFSISFAKHPAMTNERSWDGMNYSMQDSCATRGTISFTGDTFVGVFRYDKSERCPWHAKKPYDVDAFFRGIPPPLRKLAEKECLQYNLDEFDGKTFPVITSAFWGDGIAERVQAAEPWDKLLEHGAKLAAVDFMSDADAYAWLGEYVEMEPEYFELARTIHARKLAAGKKKIELTKDEVKLLRALEGGKEGLQAARESFQAIGIKLP